MQISHDIDHQATQHQPLSRCCDPVPTAWRLFYHSEGHPRSGDVHTVANEVAVRFVDHVANVDTDTELYPSVLGRLGVVLLRKAVFSTKRGAVSNGQGLREYQDIS